MKVVVTSSDTDLDAPISLLFARCPVYLLVDTDTMHFEAFENPENSSLRGAGFHAPEFIVERGAQAVVTGNVGPHAFQGLHALGVPVYLFGGGTVRKAIEAYKAGRLRPVEGASVPTHNGRTRVAASDDWYDW